MKKLIINARKNKFVEERKYNQNVLRLHISTVNKISSHNNVNT